MPFARKFSTANLSRHPAMLFQLLDSPDFVKQKIWKNPLPHRVHHRFHNFHQRAPLPKLFYAIIIFSFLRMSRERKIRTHPP